MICFLNWNFLVTFGMLNGMCSIQNTYDDRHRNYDKRHNIGWTLFVCLFVYSLRYSPGLVPKPKSQDEEDPEESKAREQDQQRRRM